MDKQQAQTQGQAQANSRDSDLTFIRFIDERHNKPVKPDHLLLHFMNAEAHLFGMEECSLDSRVDMLFRAYLDSKAEELPLCHCHRFKPRIGYYESDESIEENHYTLIACSDDDNGKVCTILRCKNLEDLLAYWRDSHYDLDNLRESKVNECEVNECEVGYTLNAGRNLVSNKLQ